MLGPEIFFSLNGFRHRTLWQSEDFAWQPIETVSNYLKRFPHQIDIEIPSHIFLENTAQISIGKGTILEPGVLIQGPCIIGKNCIIRHGAMLRDGVILGDGCVIGHATEVKHSILLDGAHATHLCYVGDSILGRNVNLGAGVKCANLRLDRKEISIFLDGQKIKTGLKKMGAIVGDGAQIGCNCVLNPGTLVGKEAASHPLLHLGGYIPARNQVKKERDWTLEPIAGKILEKLLK